MNHFLCINVNVNVPVVLSNFDRRAAARHFINEKRRRVKDTPKADKQACFQKVFKVMMRMKAMSKMRQTM
jgi:hypothetical protein